MSFNNDKKSRYIRISKFFLMNSNIELTTLLQIVDDTNSMNQRRNNIFSKSSKYIGINVGKMSNGLYCFYLLFGKDKN